MCRYNVYILRYFRVFSVYTSVIVYVCMNITPYVFNIYHTYICIGVDDEEAKEKLVLIVEAFNVLGDSTKKSEYDKTIDNTIAVDTKPNKRASFTGSVSNATATATANATAMVKDLSKVISNSSVVLKSAISSMPAVGAELFSSDIPDESMFVSQCLCK